MGDRNPSSVMPTTRGGQGDRPGPASSLASLLAQAVALHQTGRLEQAKAHYRRILAAEPDQVDALHLLGVVAHQMGKHEEAIRSIRGAIAINDSQPSFHNNLGEAYRASWRINEAVDCYRRAIALKPDYAEAHSNLGHALRDKGRAADAIDSYRRAIALKGDLVDAHASLGHALRKLGRRDEAIECYRRALAIRPDLEDARFMLDALVNPRRTTAPRGYVARLFDRYANVFDAHLTGTLRYDVPRLLRAAITRAAGEDAGGWRILDLGCGTGLCGPLFRELGRHLAGVDLSAKMIARARARGVYDELVVGDLCEFLHRQTEPTDLVLAADVFVYVGDLAEVFAACAAAVRDGAWFAFSTEAAEGDPFVLRASGRFAHSPGYIRGLARQYGFEVGMCDAITIRLDETTPLPGHLHVLRK